MRLTAQVYTGEARPIEVEHLTVAVLSRPGKSMMQRVSVDAFSLALVLDRLAYLEERLQREKRQYFSPKDWREETEREE